MTQWNDYSIEQPKRADRPRAIVFDLDGTLADISHRLHHIKDGKEMKEKPNWDAFNAECIGDKPKKPIVHMIRMYKNAGYTVVICSGRNDTVADKTQFWLRTNGIKYDMLLMRKHDDRQSDATLKAQMFQNVISRLYEVELVVDDRKKVVDVWRSFGLTCLQCQEGDY